MMEKTIHYIDKDAFLRILDQWPEVVYVASFDMTVLMLDKDLKLIGPIALPKSYEI